MQPQCTITVFAFIWATVVYWIINILGQHVHKLQLLMELKIITPKCANYESEVLHKEVVKILL
jgi:hypothetical protein